MGNPEKQGESGGAGNIYEGGNQKLDQEQGGHMFRGLHRNTSIVSDNKIPSLLHRTIACACKVCSWPTLMVLPIPYLDHKYKFFKQSSSQVLS